MAVFRNIARSNPLTNFQQPVAPQSSVFDVLATAANSAFQVFDPVAREQALQDGQRQGFDAAGPYRPPGGAPGATPVAASAGAGGLNPAFDQRLSGLLSAAEAAGHSVSLSSGYRSPESQASIIASNWGNFDLSPADRARWEADVAQFGAVEAGRRWADVFNGATRVVGGAGSAGTPFRNWIALPGLSNHQRGLAGDLSYGSAEAREWIHANAAHFGLHFPLSNVNWHIELMGDDGGRVFSAPGGVAAPAGSSAPPVEIRNSAGELELADPSIFTSTYERIRQEAAAGTYSARVIVQAQSDLSEMRRQFQFDPQGFADAATGYIGDLVDRAPQRLAVGLSLDLEAETARHVNGIRAEVHRETMQEASAATGALTERYAQQYTDLLAAGDEEGAARVRSQLDDVLRYREAMPGVAWTSEQSENVILAAERGAARVRDQSAVDRSREVGSQLDDIRRIAEAGRHSVDEALLETPEFQTHPDFAEAALAVSIRDRFPDLLRMTPEDQDALIAEERQRLVGEPFELDYMDAIESAVQTSRNGLASDPVAYAQEHGITPTVEIPAFDGTNMQEVVGSMAARLEQGLAMREAGYVDQPRFFTNAEVEQLGASVSIDAPAEQRQGMAISLVSAFGTNAEAAARELEMSEASQHWIGLAGISGNVNAMTQALQGEAMLRANEAVRPETENRALENVAPEIFDALPNDPVLRSRLMTAAEALAAFNSGGTAPDAAVMRDAVNQAAGFRPQSGSGGVQEVLGGESLLPPGVSADQIDAAFDRLFVVQDPHFISEQGGRFFRVPMVGNGVPDVDVEAYEQAQRDGTLADLYASAGFESFTTREEAEALGFGGVDPRRWGPLGPPMVDGLPISRSMLNLMRLEPVTQNGNLVLGQYFLSHPNPNVAWDVLDGEGNVYVLDLSQIMDF